MSLTKAHIVEKVVDEVGLTKAKSVQAVERILEIMKSTLASGDDVLISGFGKFCIKEKNARKGRNPSTGESMMLKPRRIVTFKCSGKLRRKCNGKPCR